LASSILHGNRNFLGANLIIGGYDEIEGFKLFYVPRGGAMINVPDFTTCGSGGDFANSYLQSNYRKNMTFEEAKNAAVAGKLIFPRKFMQKLYFLTKISYISRRKKR